MKGRRFDTTVPAAWLEAVEQEAHDEALARHAWMRVIQLVVLGGFIGYSLVKIIRWLM